MRLSDSELETLLQNKESDRVEFKESYKGDAPEKVRQAICAFANDLPGRLNSSRKTPACWSP
jgi:ATP-dependent DNA helicase RecG